MSGIADFPYRGANAYAAPFRGLGRETAIHRPGRIVLSRIIPAGVEIDPPVLLQCLPRARPGDPRLAVWYSGIRGSPASAGGDTERLRRVNFKAARYHISKMIVRTPSRLSQEQRQMGPD